MGKEPRVQTGLRLDSGTIDRLRQSGRGLSDEIRDRLERTFKDDAIDPATRELQLAVANVANRLEMDCGAAWHVSPLTRRAFVAALNTLVTQIANKSPNKVDTIEAALHPADPLNDPETIGRLRALDEIMDANPFEKTILRAFDRLNANESLTDLRNWHRSVTKQNGDRNDDKKTGTQRRRNRRTR